MGHLVSMLLLKTNTDHFEVFLRDATSSWNVNFTVSVVELENIKFIRLIIQVDKVKLCHTNPSGVRPGESNQR